MGALGGASSLQAAPPSSPSARMPSRSTAAIAAVDSSFTQAPQRS